MKALAYISDDIGKILDVHSVLHEENFEEVDEQECATFSLIKNGCEDTNQANAVLNPYVLFPRRSRDSWGPELLEDYQPYRATLDETDINDIRPGSATNILPKPTGPGGRDDIRRKKVTDSLCKREALKPVRVFTFNHRVPVINLSDGNNTRVFFTSGHLAVIYDIKDNNQHILRGHVSQKIVSKCSLNLLGEHHCVYLR